MSTLPDFAPKFPKIIVFSENINYKGLNAVKIDHKGLTAVNIDYCHRSILLIVIDLNSL